MPRQKAFIKEDVLQRAISLFWAKGYAATSTEELLAAMGIGRQSLYDTFGDKRQLFLEALRTYNTESVADIARRLRARGSPLSVIEDVLVELAGRHDTARARGCFGVIAICELADVDPEVRSISATSGAFVEAALTDAVERAKAAGEIPKSVAAGPAARFLGTTLVGMKVQARAGAPVEALREIAAFAIAGLRRR